MHIRRLALTMTALLGLALPSVATAHAELVSSQPADGSTLGEPPSEVILTFAGELSPDGSGFTLTDAGGAEIGHGEVDLSVADRNVLRGAVSIRRDGPYEVVWQAVSIDGHAEEGTISFRVGPIPDAPDTALRHPSPLVPIGALMLLLSALAARRSVAGGRLTP